jgi:hypothetical protein
VLDPAFEAAAQSIAAMNGVAFGVIRIRWNMNAVRLPVSVRAWRRDGGAYLDRVAAIVRRANDAELAVVLAAYQDAPANAASTLGLPNANTVAFWREWAARFRDNPRVIFSVFNRCLRPACPAQSPDAAPPATGGSGLKAARLPTERGRRASRHWWTPSAPPGPGR